MSNIDFTFMDRRREQLADEREEEFDDEARQEFIVDDDIAFDDLTGFVIDTKPKVVYEDERKAYTFQIEDPNALQEAMRMMLAGDIQEVD